MDPDSRYELNEQARMPEVEPIFCSCCGLPLSDSEIVDPCIIDGYYFKDSCAGNLTQLRLQGYIKEVSDRTKKLVEARWREDGIKAWQRVCDETYRTVKHI